MCSVCFVVVVDCSVDEEQVVRSYPENDGQCLNVWMEIWRGK